MSAYDVRCVSCTAFIGDRFLPDYSTVTPTLLDLIQERDEEGWRIVFRLYVPFLHQCLKGDGVSSSEADDIVSQTLLATYVSVRNHQFHFMPNGRGFRQYVRKVAKNKAMDLVRKKGLPLAPDPVEECPEHSSTSDRQEDLEILRNILVSLQREVSEKDFKAFNETYIRERSNREVAQELGITEENVAQIRHRMLEKLRDRWRLFDNGSR
jgi:RNA polymerase sigma factor (sigma-70 family)